MPKVKRIKASQLNRALNNETRKVQRAAKRAAAATANKGARVVAAKVPKAFGALRSSVDGEGTTTGGRIVADAPHAAFVERGTRPHMPPLKPIEAWVRLRVGQALTSTGGAFRSGKKATGFESMAKEVHSSVLTAKGRVSRRQGTSMEIGSKGPIRQMAFVVARAIAKRGTKPHWYARASLSTLRGILDSEMKRRLKKG